MLKHEVFSRVVFKLGARFFFFFVSIFIGRGSILIDGAMKYIIPFNLLKFMRIIIYGCIHIDERATKIESCLYIVIFMFAIGIDPLLFVFEYMSIEGQNLCNRRSRVRKKFLNSRNTKISQGINKIFNSQLEIE